MRGRRGSAAIELALVAPILILLFLFGWQFGFSYYVYAQLEQAANAGARYASLATYDAANPASFRTAVQNVVVYGNPAGGSAPVVNGLAPANVTVTVAVAGSMPVSVTVAINGYRIPAVVSPVTLANKPSVQYPYLGNWAPAS